MNDDTKEQLDKQAPPPAFMSSVLFQAKEEPKIKPGNDQDKVLVDLSTSDAWKVLKKYIEARQVKLASELRESIKGSSMEEIGFRFLITDTVNDFANKIINFVEAPAAILRLQNERRDIPRDSTGNEKSTN